MVRGCQTCLRVIKDPSEGLYITSVTSASAGTSLIEQLTDCIPELILEDKENVVLCHPCAQNLRSAYKFKQRCLETQQKIYGFLQQIPANNQFDVGKIAVYYQRMETTVKVVDPAIVDTSSKPQKMPYNCTQCQFACLDKCVLIFHEVLHESNEPPYKCKECFFIFPTTTLLLDHLAIHTSERPYACNLCDFVTAVHKDLKEHGANHRKNFQCTICWKRFPSKKELATHVEGHKNEDDMRPFRCGWCNFTCDTVNMLRIHRNDRHKQAFKCKHCKVPCRTEFGLMQHMKWIHSKRMQTTDEVHVYDTVNCNFTNNLIVVPDNEDTSKSTFAACTSRSKLSQPDTFTSTINRDVESLFDEMHRTGTMVNACQSISGTSQFQSFDTTNIAPDAYASGFHTYPPPISAHEVDRNWQPEGINRIDVYIGNSSTGSRPCNVLSNSDQIDIHPHSEAIDRINSYASNCVSYPTNYVLNSGEKDVNHQSGSINKIDSYITRSGSHSSIQQLISGGILCEGNNIAFDTFRSSSESRPSNHPSSSAEERNRNREPEGINRTDILSITDRSSFGSPPTNSGDRHRNPQSDIAPDACKSSSGSRPSKRRSDSSKVRSRNRESEGVNGMGIASNSYKNSSGSHSSKLSKVKDKSRQLKSIKTNRRSRDFKSDNGPSRNLSSNRSSRAGIVPDKYKGSSGTRASNSDEVRSRNRQSKGSNRVDIASDTYRGSSGIRPSNSGEDRDRNKQSKDINRTGIASDTCRSSSESRPSNSGEVRDTNRQSKDINTTCIASDTYRSNSETRPSNSGEVGNSSRQPEGINRNTTQNTSGAVNQPLYITQMPQRNREPIIYKCLLCSHTAKNRKFIKCHIKRKHLAFGIPQDISRTESYSRNDVTLPNVAENLNAGIQLSTGEQNNLYSSQAASFNQNVNMTFHPQLLMFPLRGSIAPALNNPFSWIQKYLESNMNSVQTPRTDQHSIMAMAGHQNMVQESNPNHIHNMGVDNHGQENVQIQATISGEGMGIRHELNQKHGVSNEHLGGSVRFNVATNRASSAIELRNNYQVPENVGPNIQTTNGQETVFLNPLYKGNIQGCANQGVLGDSNRQLKGSVTGTIDVLADSIPIEKIKVDAARKVFPCRVCGETQTSRSALRSHVKKHSNSPKLALQVSHSQIGQHVNIPTSTAAPANTMTPIYVQRSTKKKIPAPVPPGPVPSTLVPNICLPAQESEACTPSASSKATPQALPYKTRRQLKKNTRRVLVPARGGGFIRIPRKSLPSTHPYNMLLQVPRPSKIMDINDVPPIADKNGKLHNEKGEHSNSDALQTANKDVNSETNITPQHVGDNDVDGSHNLGSTEEKSDSINVDMNKLQGKDEVHQNVDLTVLDENVQTQNVDKAKKSGEWVCGWCSEELASFFDLSCHIKSVHQKTVGDWISLTHFKR